MGKEIICLLTDSESEEADCPADPPSRPGSTPSTHTAMHQAPSFAGSPLVGQQQQQTRSSGDGPAAQRQLLSDFGFCHDAEADAARQQYLQRTGKGIAREPLPVKPEDEGGEPTAADIAELQAQLLDNPRLQRLLSSGEGSSQHQWRMRVYQALLKQQDQLLRQAHRQQQQEDDLMVISDSEEEKEEEAPPAKKQRTMPHPPPAAAAPAPGSVAIGARAGSTQLAAQLLRQGMAALSSGRLSKSTQPVSSSKLPAQQPQQPRKPPVDRAPRQRKQQQQQQQPAAAPNPAAAAAAAAAAAGGGYGDGDTGGTFAEREGQRALRARLTRLEATAVSKRQEVLESGGGKLVSMLCDLQTLGQQTKRPREAAQHAGVMATCIKSGVEMIQAFSTSRRGRDPSHLVASLRTTFALDRGAAVGSQEERPVRINWAAIGAASSHLFRTVPGVSSMQGALAAAAKAPRAVVRRQRTQLEAEVRPAVGPEVQDNGLGQATDQLVKEMRGQLERVGRASVVALVLDHDSFAHTLENVFALSFLCKDMFAGLEEDEEEGLVATHVSGEARKQLMRAAEAAGGSGRGSQQGAAGRLVPRQFMMELDMSTWEDMKAVVGRGETLMPQRPPHAQH